ncbi:MAG: urate hydroxylase PuuD [Candidatus Neomarinimicrobiota bacterium]|jgi:uncharacterized membrane protein|nr:urate hydroxylase PuuD [Candidatus Neomarinimicrobiota bacterium]|tara:strand:- start:556 stop:1344 length:789 start_codon:yes stop_codon:yes gene_type:complete
MEDYIHPIFRWLHIFAGVMWIGLLYFFNFVNAPFAGTMDGDTKKKVVPELMPRALYWFRMGAAWTWFTGLILLYLVFWSGSLAMGSGDNMMSDGVVNVWTHVMITFTFLAVFVYDFLYKSPLAKNVRLVTVVAFLLIVLMEFLMIKFGQFSYRAFNIHIGSMFGTIMAFNVWFRIWPAQKRIITAIKDGSGPDGNDVALAGLRSKHNTYMSVPLFWTMMNQHTVLFNSVIAGVKGLVLLVVIVLGWHIVFQFYKKSAKIKGF